jgi:DNA-binding SARP family transcriptional activator/predicted ATPase
MSRLSLELLGPLRITLDGNPVKTLESVKVRALLAFLALERDDPHGRDELVGLLWAEHSQDRARGNLRRALWNLQQSLKDDGSAPFLLTTREAIQFNPGGEARVDVSEFRAALAACETHPHRTIETCHPCLERLERAVALYRGELLQNFSVADAPAFEEWLLLRREQFQRLVITALGQVIRHYETMGAAGYAATERYARLEMELEPWGEEPYRALMRTYAAQNQSEQAIAVYHAMARVLHQELNLEPSAETKALYKHLAGQTLSGRASSASHTPSPVAGLPVPSTPLVGRELELAELAEKITRADCRLLTLVGQGGIGKTRLALETARANRAAFPRGAYFVDLAAVTSFDRLPHAVAEAMHLPPGGSAPLAQQLTEHFQDLQAPLLLILDNMEQLLAGDDQDPALRHGGKNDTGIVGDWMQRAPQLTLLVTSRERLNLAGEWLYPVEGLRAPAVLPARIAPGWNSAEAVALFVQCAARQNMDADAWSDGDKRAVMHLTQLVEGMPLAIELAAGWLRTLSPADIADEIARGLDVLTSTRRDLPARHASIRAVFEHSWVLLTAAEQDAFARMSVFRGGFTRQAAREVADAALPTISALVEKSLVKRGAAGRFRMHELVRQFAAEKLELQGGRELTRARHADYFLDLVAERGPALNTAEARAALTELQHDAENVRAAWQWSSQHRDPTVLQGAVAPLAAFTRWPVCSQKDKLSCARPWG